MADPTPDNLQPSECLEYGTSRCRGPVGWHMLPTATRAWPRCDKHWGERYDRYERDERPLTGHVPPSWFDPDDAGETW
jgi:hypothetical protein